MPSACHFFFGSAIIKLNTFTEGKVLHTMGILELRCEIQQTIVTDIAKVVFHNNPVDADEFDEATAASILITWRPLVRG